MKHAYLEVTYRKGRPIAAYYYLPRHDNERSVRTQDMGGGLLVDYAASEKPIGIEITAPSHVDLATLNNVLTQLGQEAAHREDVAPLSVA